MIRLILLFLFIPVLCSAQNMITTMSLSKVIDSTYSKDGMEYDLYTLKIYPGYKDRNFIIELTQKDSSGKEVILSRPQIKAELIIHRADYKMPDGKYEWDYSTEVKSNNTWKDEHIEIGDCSNMKYVKCFIRVKNSEKYKIITYNDDEKYGEFLIGE